MSSTKRLAPIVIGIVLFPFMIVAIIAGILARPSQPDNTPPTITWMPVVADNLDTFDVAWHLGDGWSHSPIDEGGMALTLFGPPNSPTQYSDERYEAVAVSFRLQVSAGEARLYVQRSTAGMIAVLIDAAGQAKLYHNAALLGEAPYPIEPSGWNRVQFIAMGNQLRLTINDSVIIDVTDENPLPAGTIAFDGAGVPVRLMVDDFALARPNEVFMIP